MKRLLSLLLVLLLLLSPWTLPASSTAQDLKALTDWQFASQYQKVPLTLAGQTYYAYEITRTQGGRRTGWLITDEANQWVSDPTAYSKLALAATVSRYTKEQNLLSQMESTAQILNEFQWKFVLYEIAAPTLKTISSIVAFLQTGIPASIPEELTGQVVALATPEGKELGNQYLQEFTQIVGARLSGVLGKAFKTVADLKGIPGVGGLMATLEVATRKAVYQIFAQGRSQFLAALKILQKQSGPWSAEEAEAFLQAYKEGKVKSLAYGAWYIRLLPANFLQGMWDLVGSKLLEGFLPQISTIAEIAVDFPGWLEELLKSSEDFGYNQVEKDIQGYLQEFTIYRLWSDPSIAGSPAANVLAAVRQGLAVGPPSNLSPADGTLLDNLQPILSWNPGPNATDYRLQVATDDTFSNPILNETTAGKTSYQIPEGKLSQGITYYWRVRAGSASGQSEWAKSTFNTPAPPGPTGKIAYWSENVLYLLDLATGKRSAILPGKPYLIEATWTQDGSRLAYSESGGSLFVARGDGSEVRQIHSGAWHPAWSPDGTMIAFTSKPSPESGGVARLGVINADGGEVKWLAERPDTLSQPCWSPDGSKIALTMTAADYEHSEAFVCAADGSGEQPLAIPSNLVVDIIGWVKGGQSLTYQASGPNYGGTIMNGDLALCHLGEGGSSALDAGLNGSMSPDGSTMAYFKLGWSFYTIRLDNSKQLELYSFKVVPYLWAPGPALWSPDGQWLAFRVCTSPIVGERGGSQDNQLWVIRTDGSGLTRLANEGINIEDLVAWLK